MNNNNNNNKSFLIIKNKVIFNQILKHLRLFNNILNYSKIKYFDNYFNLSEQIYKEYYVYLNLSILNCNRYKFYLYEICNSFPNLETLILPNSFNDIIKIQDFNNHYNLKHIVFGDSFDNESFSTIQSDGNITNVLPNTIESITFGTKFNKKINNGSLPNSLKKLVLGYSWKLDLKDSLYLPNQIEELQLGRGFSLKLNLKFPSSLKKLNLKSDVGVIDEGILNEGLEYLTLIGEYNSPFKSNALPSTLQYLELGNRFNQNLENLPIGLKVLKLGDNFDKKLIPGSLPPQLSILEIGNYTHTFAPGLIPNSLKEITIKDSLDNSIYNNNNNNKSSISLIENSFPKNGQLKSFNMGHFFNLTISPNVLPESIESLHFKELYNKLLQPGSIPTSCKNLIIENSSCLLNNTLKNNYKLESLTIRNSAIQSSIVNESFQLPNDKPSLKFLEIDSIIPNKLPNTIETLIIKVSIPQQLKYNIFSMLNLKKLIIKNQKTNISKEKIFDIQLNGLPKSIQHLEISHFYITISENNNFKSLENLEKLVIHFGNTKKVNKELFPISLKSLELNRINGIQTIELKEFYNLKSFKLINPFSNSNNLYFSYDYHEIETLELPDTLLKLKLKINLKLKVLYYLDINSQLHTPFDNIPKVTDQSKSIAQQLIQSLPKNLNKLYFDCYYENQILNLDERLPDSIEYLTINSTKHNTPQKLSNLLPNYLKGLIIYYNENFNFSKKLNIENFNIKFLKHSIN